MNTYDCDAKLLVGYYWPLVVLMGVAVLWPVYALAVVLLRNTRVYRRLAGLIRRVCAAVGAAALAWVDSLDMLDTALDGVAGLIDRVCNWCCAPFGERARLRRFGYYLESVNKRSGLSRREQLFDDAGKLPRGAVAFAVRTELRGLLNQPAAVARARSLAGRGRLPQGVINALKRGEMPRHYRFV